MKISFNKMSDDQKHNLIGVSCILSMISLGYFVYNILKNYQPKELLSLYSGSIIWLSSIVISIHICCMIYRIERTTEKKVLTNLKIIKQIGEFGIYIKEWFSMIHTLCYARYLFIKPIVTFSGKCLIKITQYSRYMFIVMDIGIRVTIALVFLIDVCLFESFELFSKIILLILIPIALKIIAYVLGYTGNDIVEKIDEIALVFEDASGEISFEFDEPQCSNCQIKYFRDWCLGHDMVDFYIAYLDNKKSALANRFYVFIHIIYILSWGIIIIKAI